MKITLKNVGCIKNASVELAGLNVIAGPNGAGKSTIGKTIYTIIKAINDSSKIVFNHKKFVIRYLARDIFYSIQNNLKNKNNKFNTIDILMNNFFYARFSSILLDFLQAGEYEKAQQKILENIELLKKFETLDEKAKISIQESLKILLEQCIPSKKSIEIKQALDFMYESIFKGQINNLGSHKTSEVTLDINDNIFSYNVSNNSEVLPFLKRLSLNKFNENFIQSIFPQATFIETPLILQLSEVTNLPFYWKDLIEKLKQENPLSESSNICNSIYKEISNIIGGELIYNTDKQDFFFVPKDTDNKLYVNNMASGEKLFGILQKMAKLDLISPAHLLIFDEPENHLHPQWQVKLADIFTTLVEKDIPVLLTTHSSTLINALQDFSEAKEISKKTNFYFADDKNKTIKNVKDIENKEIDIIFESFYRAKEFLPNI